MAREINIIVLDCLGFLKVRHPSRCDVQLVCRQSAHSEDISLKGEGKTSNFAVRRCRLGPFLAVITL